ncbi:MAG: hypothetical protein IJO32_07165 [Bacilli bacterium]|nr:hypothetical protein [Bacilli bacterium]
MNIIVNHNFQYIKLDTSDLKKIGSGCEGNVYKYQDIAIKVHDDIPIKKTLSQKLVKQFKNIDTKRILLPNGLTFEKAGIFLKYVGYTTQLISNKLRKERLIDLDSNHIYDEIQLLKNDIKLLSENKISVDDLNSKDNLVFNGDLYFVDPGSYNIDNGNFNELYTKNMDKLNYALYLCLFCLYNDSNYIMYELKNINGTNIENINYKIVPLIRNIYTKYFKNEFLDKTNGNYIEAIIQILEKHDSILNYKDKILNDFVNNSNEEVEDIKTIKKILR